MPGWEVEDRCATGLLRALGKGRSTQGEVLLRQVRVSADPWIHTKHVNHSDLQEDP